MLGKADGVLYCLGLATPMGDNDIAINSEETCSARFPVIYPPDQGAEPDIKELRALLHVIGIGEHLANVSQL